MAKHPELVPVESSAITGYHIDPTSGDVTVRYRSGDVWRYAEVSLERRTAFEGAQSKGHYLATQIKPHHAGVKL